MASTIDPGRQAKWQIFILGTNNWQGGGEFAPGSGILHAGHHEALNALPSVAGRCFSMWPSSAQKTPPDRTDYRVFELPHQIPICESVSPVSNKRWHSMDEEEFNAYRSRLVSEVEAFIADVESDGSQFNLFMAHHTFVNPTVMVAVNQRRVANGKPAVPVVVFAHGTALKMYENEMRKEDEYPLRFLPWMREQGEKVFEGGEKVAGVFAIADAQKATFEKIFPAYPAERVTVTPNGYNQSVFKPAVGATKESVLAGIDQVLYDGFDADAVLPTEEHRKRIGSFPILDVSSYEHVVLFVGKFADWKRVDTVLKAAQKWEQHDPSRKILTLIVGGGTNDTRQLYVDTAYKQLALEHTFFLGPRPQPDLARLFTVADVGVFPSKREPFGLVFIECMGCGTPVIGANSGGPVEFVRPDVGALVDEGTNDEVAAGVHRAVLKALDEGWKESKGPRCLEYAVKNFSLHAQCVKMLASVEKNLTSRI